MYTSTRSPSSRSRSCAAMLVLGGHAAAALGPRGGTPGARFGRPVSDAARRGPCPPGCVSCPRRPPRPGSRGGAARSNCTPPRPLPRLPPPAACSGRASCCFLYQSGASLAHIMARGCERARHACSPVGVRRRARRRGVVRPGGGPDVLHMPGDGLPSRAHRAPVGTGLRRCHVLRLCPRLAEAPATQRRVPPMPGGVHRPAHVRPGPLRRGARHAGALHRVLPDWGPGRREPAPGTRGTHDTLAQCHRICPEQWIDCPGCGKPPCPAPGCGAATVPIRRGTGGATARASVPTDGAAGRPPSPNCSSAVLADGPCGPGDGAHRPRRRVPARVHHRCGGRNALGRPHGRDARPARARRAHLAAAPVERMADNHRGATGTLLAAAGPGARAGHLRWRHLLGPAAVCRQRGAVAMSGMACAAAALHADPTAGVGRRHRDDAGGGRAGRPAVALPAHAGRPRRAGLAPPVASCQACGNHIPRPGCVPGCCPNPPPGRTPSARCGSGPCPRGTTAARTGARRRAGVRPLRRSILLSCPGTNRRTDDRLVPGSGPPA